MSKDEELKNPPVMLSFGSQGVVQKLSLESPEHDEDRKSRLSIVAMKAQEKHVTYYVFLGMYSVAFLWSLYVSSCGNSDNATFAHTVLSSILTGSVGFLVGRSNKEEK